MTWSWSKTWPRARATARAACWGAWISTDAANSRAGLKRPERPGWRGRSTACRRRPSNCRRNSALPRPFPWPSASWLWRRTRSMRTGASCGCTGSEATGRLHVQRTKAAVYGCSESSTWSPARTHDAWPWPSKPTPMPKWQGRRCSRCRSRCAGRHGSSGSKMPGAGLFTVPRLLGSSLWFRHPACPIRPTPT